MADIPVRWVRLNKEDRDEYMDSSHNEPPADADRDEFNAETLSVINQLKAELGKEWQEGMGDGDFFISIDYVPDRFLCVEVSSRKMLGMGVIKVVHDLVLGLEPDYSVDICNSWVFLRTETGETHPHFNIFVEKDRILIYSESQTLFEKLGVSRSEMEGYP